MPELRQQAMGHSLTAKLTTREPGWSSPPPVIAYWLSA
jgi:hypothetical protein